MTWYNNFTETPTKPANVSKPAAECSNSSFSWPFAKKHSSPSIPNQQRSTNPQINTPPSPIIPKPKVVAPTFSLLACLDTTYYDKNNAAASPPPTPSSEESLSEVLVEEPPSIITTTTTTTKTIPTNPPIHQEASSPAESDNSSVISATPPTPPDRKRFVHKTQQRQTMMSDFLKRKWPSLIWNWK